jgi:hypothetical protein
MLLYMAPFFGAFWHNRKAPSRFANRRSSPRNRSRRGVIGEKISQICEPAKTLAQCYTVRREGSTVDTSETATAPVNFQELLDAFELAGFDSGLGVNHLLLCKETGKIHWQSDYDEELSDEIDDNRTYIDVPDKRELGLGKPLVLEFVGEFLPNDFDEVRSIFGRRGAYARFRDLLARRRAVDRWYDFESKATERALREWCELNAIALVG